VRGNEAGEQEKNKTYVHVITRLIAVEPVDRLAVLPRLDGEISTECAGGDLRLQAPVDAVSEPDHLAA